MREIELIKNASPCDTDYTDKSIQSLSDAKKKGRMLCSNLEECQEGGIFCTLNLGWRMAKFVIEGEDLEKTLESEGEDFLEEHPQGKFWTKKNGEWSVVEGKSNAIDYMKEFVITVIDDEMEKFKPAKSAKPSEVIINMSNAIDSTIKDLKDEAKEFKR